MKGMYGAGPGDKVAKVNKVVKKVAKVADKAVKRMNSAKDSGKVLKSMSKVGVSASDFASSVAKSAATKGQTKEAMNYLKSKKK